MDSQGKRAINTRYALLYWLATSSTDIDATRLIESAWRAADADPSSPVHERAVVAALLSAVAARDEARAVDRAALTAPAESDDRFEDATSRWRDHWRVSPPDFGDVQRERLAGVVAQTLARLSIWPRAVVILRDFANWKAEQVCALLRIDPEQERLLLRDARDRIVRALEGAAHRSTNDA